MQTFHPIRLGNSVSGTTSSSSQRVALPTLASGALPKFVRVCIGQNAGAGAYGYVKPGDSSVVATTNDILAGTDNVLTLNVTGCTHIAFIQYLTTVIAINFTAVEA